MSVQPKDMIVLIDGNNSCFRVGHANQHLTNNGEPTGVIYGFLREVLGVWERWKNAKIIVCWDGGSEYRLNLSKQGIADGIITAEQGYYKQNRERKKQKEEAEGKINDLVESIVMQKPTLVELLNNTLVQQIKIDGFEADDIIGTLATRHGERGDIVKIMSSDKDMYQLLSPNISIFLLNAQKCLSCEMFEGEFGLTPSQWIDIGALSGDDGDNIHGISGVGEKTAIKLLSKAAESLGVDKKDATYRTIFEYVQSIPEKKRKKTEQKILEGKEIVELAYQLKKIITDISGLPEAAYNKSNPRTTKYMLESLGFKSIVPSTGLLTRRAWI